MFPLHRGIRFKTIAKSEGATSLPPRFHKCNADNDAIIPPRFLSSRSSSSSSSFYLSRHARAPFMSLSCYSPSRFTLVVPAPILRTGNFNGSLQFPLNRISFTDDKRRAVSATVERQNAIAITRRMRYRVCTETFTDRSCINYRSRSLASR